MPSGLALAVNVNIAARALLAAAHRCSPLLRAAARTCPFDSSRQDSEVMPWPLCDGLVIKIHEHCTRDRVYDCAVLK